MTGDRKPYRREGEERRREALIAAALELVAEGGAQGATVRAIADRAGVTPGLIRHYFASKDDLTRAAYREVMMRMQADNAAVLDLAPSEPLARLAAFVAASLSAPVVDPVKVGLWAGFLHNLRRDPAMRAVHLEIYLSYRDLLQGLIMALPRDATAAQARADAIACNGVIDGLWLEGSVLPDSFEPGEIVRIGVAAVGAILRVDLTGALPLAKPPGTAEPFSGATS